MASVRLKHIVFDWDGTLQDSIKYIVQAWQQACALLQLPVPTAAQIQSLIGLSLVECAQRLQPQLSVMAQQQLMQAYREAYRDQERQPAPLFAGIPVLLNQLQQAEIRLTIATGKGRQGLNRAMASSGIEHYFVATSTACESASKPAPEMVFRLCQSVQCSPAETMVIGDAYVDLCMANRAGARAIGVSYGAGTLAELQQAQPEAIANSPVQLAELLLR